MSEPFQREERYIVIKRKHLTNGHELDIRGYLDQIGVGTTECVVVEAAWPEYETVWEMIERRMALAAIPPRVPLPEPDDGCWYGIERCSLPHCDCNALTAARAKSES